MAIEGKLPDTIINTLRKERKQDEPYFCEL